MLDKAIQIATIAHSGQVDKGGQPYILHPLRVMFGLEGEKERIVAVLHDVLEDTNVTLECLREQGFDEEILEALESVTRIEIETYEEFIDRAKLNTIGKKVKEKDLDDNMDVTRILNPTERDFKRLEKYRKAKKRLLE